MMAAAVVEVVYQAVIFLALAAAVLEYLVKVPVGQALVHLLAVQVVPGALMAVLHRS